MQKMGARDSSLDFLRVMSIAGVIAIHSIATMVLSSPVGSSHWLIANIIDSSVRWCVPVFIMISGALLINPQVFDERWSFIKKRIGRIGLAIIVWPMIYMIWNWLQSGVPPHFSTYAYSMLAGTPAPGHLYFLFIIAGLYLLTPVISLYITHLGKKEVYITVFILLLVSVIWDFMSIFIPGQEGAQTLNFATRHLPYIGYYVAGYALKDFRTNRPAFYLIGYVLAVGLLAYLSAIMSHHYSLDKGLSFYSFTSLPVVLMSVSLFIFIRECYWRFSGNKQRGREILKSLSIATFGVYLMHIIILSASVRYLNLNLLSIKGAALAFALTLATTYMLTMVMLRIRFLRPIIS